MAQRQKADAMSSDSAAEMAKQQSNKGSLGKNMFNKFLGNILEDTCESNYDCERPEVCCDLGFKRMCCRSGLGVYNGVPPNMRLARVVVTMVVMVDILIGKCLEPLDCVVLFE